MAKSAYGGGSLAERPGYKGQWRLRWREDGRHRETTFRGSKAAAAAELRERVRLAGAPAPANMPDDAEDGHTVGDALDAWLAQVDGDRARRYVDESRSAIDRRIRPEIGGIRLERLTVADLDRLLKKWARAGLTGSSIRRYFAPLSASLKLAQRRGWATANLAELATLPRGQASAETITPTPDEFGALVRTAAERGDSEMVTAIRLAYVTSCRRGELAALRWADVDLDSGTVIIARSADRHGVDGPTKTRQRRVVQLDAGTSALLTERQRIAEGEHVLTLSVDKITDRFRKLVATTPDVRDGLRFHDLRHAGASELLAAGVPVAAVSARLGHATPRTTMDVYAARAAGSRRGCCVSHGRPCRIVPFRLYSHR